MAESKPITVVFGDGIGPEIMEAVLEILREARARLSVDTMEMGAKLYRIGVTDGIFSDTWDRLRRTKVLLKGPLATPEVGPPHPDVALRKRLKLHTNIRTFIQPAHPDRDIAIARGNSDEASTHASLIRTGFEFGRTHGYGNIACVSASDSFRALFDEAAQTSPLRAEHYLPALAAERIAANLLPSTVIVTEALHGESLCAAAAQGFGAPTLSGSAHIGDEYALFEAPHGTAEETAHQGIANPSGLLSAAILMLVHIGQPEKAAIIHAAWLATLESGIHTADIPSGTGEESVGTQEFTQAIIARLGLSL